MDEARHDPDLGFINRDDAGTVWSDQANIATIERALDLDHVIDRDAFGNADDQLHAGIGGFQNRIGAERRWHKDQRGVALSLFDRVTNSIEDWNAFYFLPSLARRLARDDLRSLSLALSRMERAFLPRNPLHHHPRILINENAHGHLLKEE